jgi:predicted glycoside hydrolase/deacetylase ChbG (UPF0249 family)
MRLPSGRKDRVGKLLIVNADDLGLDDDVNQGIVDAHRAGLVRSTSAIVNMPSTEAGIRLARNEPDLEIGLHLNLTEGKCLAAPRSIASIVDDRGYFLFDTNDIGSSIQRWRERVSTIPEMVDHITAEIDAQVDHFRGLGLRIAHLNAHHYFPLFHPRVYEAYVRVAETLGVPFRGVCEPMLQILKLPASEVAQVRAITARARVPSPPVSISNLFDAMDTSAIFAAQYETAIEAKLEELAPSSVELIVHPARRDERPRVYAWAREVESALVHSVGFRRNIAALGYSVAGYSALTLPR